MGNKRLCRSVKGREGLLLLQKGKLVHLEIGPLFEPLSEAKQALVRPDEGRPILFPLYIRVPVCGDTK